jgi:methyl-accepting chemotaxis protein
MVLADFLILIFFGHSLAQIGFRLGVPGLIFIAIYSVILGRSGQFFDSSFFQNVKNDEYANRLKKIGAVPIKMIALNVVLHPIFLAIVFWGDRLGIDPAIKSPLFLASMSFGMLIGTFIYVISDGLVSSTLLAYNLSDYPRDFRERRQELKACIIPLAATLVSLIFATAITMLGAGKSVMILVPTIFFFFCIAALSFVNKKNASALYTSITDQLENLSSEHKDLSRRISIGSVDELGTIAGMVNAFCKHLSGGIRDIKDGQKELSSVGNRLGENATGMANAITSMSGTVEQVLAKTQGQMNSVDASFNTVQRLTNHIRTMEESIAVQTSSMSQASAAVEEMVGNISSIGSVTEKMAAQFKTVGESAGKGSRIQKESGERIREIVQQSQALQEANRIIATIAANTNLLAMNAAIEAAHAGDSGKGFSVVADEIRKLAENSSKESHKIGAELKRIITTIDQIVKDAEVSGTAFAEVSHRIDDTEKLVYEVNNAIHEQKTGTGQVMNSLRVMNDITVKVSDGSHEMSKGNEAMLQEISALKISAGEISASMEEMSKGIKNINAGAHEVSDMAASTRSSIHKISATADEFEV